MKKLSLLFTFSMIICLAFTVSCVSKELPVTETYYETEYSTEYRTETYTETEDVVIKTIDGKQEIYNNTGWFSNTLTFTGGEGSKTFYYRYLIDTNKHTRSQVKIMVYPTTYGYIGVYDFTGVGEINAPPTPTDLEPKAIVLQRDKWVGNLNYILSSRLLGSYKNSSWHFIWDVNADTAVLNEISFDAKGIKEFAIFADTDNVIGSIGSVELSWSDDMIEKRLVTKERQVPYEVPVQVEKQRTVMQTKKVPFWELFFH